jgi:hypothetical protein
MTSYDDESTSDEQPRALSADELARGTFLSDEDRRAIGLNTWNVGSAGIQLSDEQYHQHTETLLRTNPQLAALAQLSQSRAYDRAAEMVREAARPIQAANETAEDQALYQRALSLQRANPTTMTYDMALDAAIAEHRRIHTL